VVHYVAAPRLAHAATVYTCIQYDYSRRHNSIPRGGLSGEGPCTGIRYACCGGGEIGGYLAAKKTAGGSATGSIQTPALTDTLLAI
jgi:hypothetical protein